MVGLNPAAGAVSERAAKPIWMVSPAFDLTFFVFSALIVLAPWIAVERFDISGSLVIAAVAVISNGPHLASTWTRVYLDGHERFKRPIAYYVIPALIIGFVIAATVIQGRRSPLLRTILLYWAFWHFLAQNWGILRIYQRKAGEADQAIAVMERAVLYLGALWPLLHRLYTGPHRLLGAEVYHPAIPWWMVNGAGALLAVAAVAYVGWRIDLWRRGRGGDLVRPLFIVSSWFGFFVPFVLIKKNGSAAFAAAACWHGIQYLAIVWVFNRNRWREGVDTRSRFVSWISQPRAAAPVVYFAALLALVGVFYGAINLAAQFALDARTWGALVWLSLTFTHYHLDGVIWKLRKPAVSRHLV